MMIIIAEMRTCFKFFVAASICDCSKFIHRLVSFHDNTVFEILEWLKNKSFEDKYLDQDHSTLAVPSKEVVEEGLNYPP